MKAIARYTLLLLRVITIIVCMTFATIITWEFISIGMIKFIFDLFIFLRIDTFLTSAVLAGIMNFYMLKYNKPRIFSELLSAQTILIYLFLSEWMNRENFGSVFYLTILFYAITGAIIGGEIHATQKQSSKGTAFLFSNS